MQLFIAHKIAASSMRGLLSFGASTTLHRQLSEDDEVLRVMSNDCIQLFSVTSSNAGQRRFMQQLTLSDHALYCVTRAARLLHHSRPNLPMIHWVLRDAYLARSDEAVYFSTMLKALNSEAFDRDNVLYDFEDLFVRQRLARCKDAISAGDFLLDWEQFEF